MPIIKIEHPLLKHKLSHIRKKSTSTKEFREFIFEISRLMAYEVLKKIKLRKIKIETPITKTIGYEIDQDINLFPILRAGLGMLAGFENLVLNTKVGHIGLYRDEKTLDPVQYLFKVPKQNLTTSLNILLDPILATGGTASIALDLLKKAGFKNIVLVIILASKKGLEKIAKKHPDVLIYVGSVDKTLLKNGYLSPGIGDAGDRMFGTK